MSYQKPRAAVAARASATPESSWVESLRTILRILAAAVLLLYAAARLFLIDIFFPTSLPVPVAVSVLTAPVVSSLLGLLALLCSWYLWRRKRRLRKQGKAVKRDGLKDRLADLFDVAQTFLERLSHFLQLLLALLPTLVLLSALAVSGITEVPRVPLQQFAYQLLQHCNNPLTSMNNDVQGAKSAAASYDSANSLFTDDMAGRARGLQDDANRARQDDAALATVAAPASYQALLDNCRQALQEIAECLQPNAPPLATNDCAPADAAPYYLMHGMADYLNHAGTFLPSEVAATLDAALTSFQDSALYAQLTSDENRLSQELVAL
jgi:hypothetical protein